MRRRRLPPPASRSGTPLASVATKAVTLLASVKAGTKATRMRAHGQTLHGTLDGIKELRLQGIQGDQASAKPTHL